jgi:DNA polymerase-3 subunit delta'
MSFEHVLGQGPAVETLTRALACRRVHHAYRFEGPRGVGKELAAFALGRALLCDAPTPLACGRCSSCHRAETLSPEEPRVPLHPDLVLVGRGVYPPSVLGSNVSEATSISVEQIRRVVIARAAHGPHEGRALVFVVRDAEELTPAAANALLKTLEEPLERTHFVLTTSRPHRLLDTVRSRTLPVRFGALPDAVVEKLLAERGLPTRVAALAEGSAELAFELADEAALEQREAFVAAARSAIGAPDLAHAIAIADQRGEGRDALVDQLLFFAQTLAREARELAATAPEKAERTARRYSIVLGTIAEVERNVAPTLALEAMVTRLRRA